MKIVSSQAVLAIFLTSIQIPLCLGERLDFTRGVETLREHLASDLGISTFPKSQNVRTFLVCLKMISKK